MPIDSNLQSALRTMYQAKDKLSIPILDNEEPIFSIKDSYVNLALIRNNSHASDKQNLTNDSVETSLATEEKDLYKTPQLITPKFLFLPFGEEEQKKPIQRILITGGAGTGKSTLCHKLAYTWATENNNEQLWLDAPYVFWLPLKSIEAYENSNDLTLVKWIYDQCIGPGKTITQAQLENALYNQAENCGLILDGLDEINHLINNTTKVGTILTEVLNFRKIKTIITSRPYQIGTGITFDRRLENIGFTEANVYQFLQKNLSTEQANPLIKLIEQNPILRSISYIPLNVYFLTNWYKKNNSSINNNFNLTQLYRNFFQEFLIRFLVKHQHKNEQRVRCYTIADLESSCDYELNILEKISFKTLIENNWQVVIPKAVIDVVLQNTSSSSTKSFQDVLNTGLLKPLMPEQKLAANTAHTSYVAAHLTFQEYLAARYLLKCLHPNNKQNASFQQALNFIIEHKYNRRYEIILCFLFGLASAENTPQKTINYLWDAILTTNFDWIGLRHIELVIRLLEQTEQDSRNHDRKQVALENIHQWIIASVKNIDKQKQFCATIRQRLSHSLTVCPRIANQCFEKIKLEWANLFPDAQVLITASYLYPLSNVSNKIAIFLIELINDNSNPELRQRVLERIPYQKIRDIQVKNKLTQKLLALLQESNISPQKIIAIIDSLIELNSTDKEVKIELQKMQNHDDLFVQIHASIALEKFTLESQNTLEKIINALHNSDANLSIQAMHAAEKLAALSTKYKSEISVELLKLLPHSEEVISNEAALILNQLGYDDPTITQKLFNALQTKYQQSKESKQQILDEFTQEKIKALLRALKDPTQEVQREAATALGKLENLTDEVINALLDAAKDPYISPDVIETLGNVENLPSKVINTFMEIINKELYNSTHSAFKALGKLKSPSTEVINFLLQAAKNYRHYSYARHALEQLCQEPSSTVREALQTAANSNNELAKEILNSLQRKIDACNNSKLEKNNATPTITQLEEIASTSDISLELSLDEVKNLLKVVTNSESSSECSYFQCIHSDAVKSLGNLKNPSKEVINALVRAAGLSEYSGTCPAVSEEATLALGKLENPPQEVIHTLLWIAQSKNHAAHKKAIKALAKLQKPISEVIETLLKIINDNPYLPDLQCEAIAALAAFPNPDTKIIAILFQIASSVSNHEEVQSKAQEVLIKLLQNPSIELINTLIETTNINFDSDGAKHKALETLHLLLEKPSILLIDILLQLAMDDSHSDFTRITAIKALSTSPNPSSKVTTSLLKIAQNNSNDYSDFFKVIETQSRLQESTSAATNSTHIISLNEDSPPTANHFASVRSAAIEALGKLQNPSVEIINLLCELATKDFNNYLSHIIKDLKSHDQLPKTSSRVIKIFMDAVANQEPFNVENFHIESLRSEILEIFKNNSKLSKKNYHPSEEEIEILLELANSHYDQYLPLVISALYKLKNSDIEIIKILTKMLISEFLKKIQSTYFWIHESAIKALGGLKNPPQKVANTLFKIANTNPGISFNSASNAVEALSKLENPSREAINTFIMMANNISNNNFTRSAAIRALGKLSDPSEETIKTLLEIASSEDDPICLDAGEILNNLVQLPSLNFITILAKIAKDDPNNFREIIKTIILNAIINLDNSQAPTVDMIPVLLTTLDDNQLNIVETALEAIAKFSELPESITKKLFLLMAHNNSTLRQKAIHTIGNIKRLAQNELSTVFLSSLLNDLKSTDTSIKNKAITKLLEFKNTQLNKLLECILELLSSQSNGLVDMSTLLEQLNITIVDLIPAYSTLVQANKINGALLSFLQLHLLRDGTSLSDVATSNTGERVLQICSQYAEQTLPLTRQNFSNFYLQLLRKLHVNVINLELPTSHFELVLKAKKPQQSQHWQRSSASFFRPPQIELFGLIPYFTYNQALAEKKSISILLLLANIFTQQAITDKGSYMVCKNIAQRAINIKLKLEAFNFSNETDRDTHFRLLHQAVQQEILNDQAQLWEYIDLSDNGIDDVCAVLIATQLATYPHCRILRLSNNKISNSTKKRGLEELLKLAKPLTSTATASLQYLLLDHNLIHFNDVFFRTQLIPTLEQSNLIHIDLSMNFIPQGKLPQTSLKNPDDIEKFNKISKAEQTCIKTTIATSLIMHSQYYETKNSVIDPNKQLHDTKGLVMLLAYKTILPPLGEHAFIAVERFHPEFGQRELLIADLILADNNKIKIRIFNTSLEAFFEKTHQMKNVHHRAAIIDNDKITLLFNKISESSDISEFYDYALLPGDTRGTLNCLKWAAEMLESVGIIKDWKTWVPSTAVSNDSICLVQ